MSEATRIGAVLAGYRVESLLGRGGMSVVYLAEHVRLGRKVALKVLASPLAHDESFRERFTWESQAIRDALRSAWFNYVLLNLRPSAISWVGASTLFSPTSRQACRPCSTAAPAASP